MPQTSPRVRSRAIITDRLGLHMRPATKLVVLARTFRSDIRVIARGSLVNAKSLLELLLLAIGCGTMLDIVAHGPDAEEAVAALTHLIDAGFDGYTGRAAAA